MRGRLDLVEYSYSVPMASDYNHLDDVPMSIHNTLAQSPAFSIVTDNQSPEALSQTQGGYIKAI